MKKKLLLLSMCGLALFAVGCGKEVEVALKDGKEVVASINGKDFTAEDLYNQLKTANGSTTLINMIDAYIANKEVKSTDEMTEKAKTQIKEMKAYYEKNNYKWEDVLANYGYTNEDSLIAEYVLNAKKEEVVNKFLSKKVTDAEKQKYYDEEIYGDYTVKHILITPETNDKMTDDEKTKAEETALKTAKNIISKLDNGEKWKDLCKKYSDDTATADKEGLIENFTKGDMVDAFWQATLKLEDGKYTKDPVESDYGYHIILKISNNEKPKLDKVNDKVVSAIVKNKLSNDEKLYNNTWIEIRDSYKMSINDSKLNDTYKNTNK